MRPGPGCFDPIILSHLSIDALSRAMGTTPRPHRNRAMEAVADKWGHVAGVVLSRVNSRKHATYRPMEMPAITMADIRTTTATISLEPIRLRVAPLIALNLTLALAMLCGRLSAIVSNALRLPSEVVIRAIRDGQPVSKSRR